jgi:hypothetical protein
MFGTRRVLACASSCKVGGNVGNRQEMPKPRSWLKLKTWLDVQADSVGVDDDGWAL